MTTASASCRPEASPIISLSPDRATERQNRSQTALSTDFFNSIGSMRTSITCLDVVGCSATTGHRSSVTRSYTRACQRDFIAPITEISCCSVKKFPCSLEWAILVENGRYQEVRCHQASRTPANARKFPVFSLHNRQTRRTRGRASPRAPPLFPRRTGRDRQDTARSAPPLQRREPACRALASDCPTLATSLLATKTRFARLC